jgi:AcrR family transcriptional regulator
MSGSTKPSGRADRRFGQDPLEVRTAAHRARTVQRILEGALTAAARHGVDSLSMGEIAAAAGVSRRTVYRYFSSRDAVLMCMSEQVRRRWEVLLYEGVRAVPAEDQRVAVVMRSILRMAEEIPESRTIFENAPAYGLAYLQQHFPDFVEAVVKAMAPVLETATAVRAGILNEREVAEILLRIAMADFLVPGDGLSSLSERVDAFWSFVGGQVPGEDRPQRRPIPAPAVRVV